MYAFKRPLLILLHAFCLFLSASECSFTFSSYSEQCDVSGRAQFPHHTYDSRRVVAGKAADGLGLQDTLMRMATENLVSYFADIVHAS